MLAGPHVLTCIQLALLKGTSLFPVVLQLLRGLGVKCDTDTTTELTPGQKFRHWCAASAAGVSCCRCCALPLVTVTRSTEAMRVLGRAFAWAAPGWQEPPQLAMLDLLPRSLPPTLILPVLFLQRGGGCDAAAAAFHKHFLRRACCGCCVCREEKGIMLRVELGPKEAAEGTCILARCRKAGKCGEDSICLG